MTMISKVFAAMIALAFLSNCSTAKKTEAPQQSAPAATATAPAPVTAKATPMETPSSLWQCSKAQETRSLQVIAKDKGCELNYVKAGKTSVTASSSHNINHCVQSEKKIKAKLEKSGYTCELKG